MGKTVMNEVTEFFEHISGSTFDVCAEFFYLYLKKDVEMEKKIPYLRTFLELYGYIISDSSRPAETRFQEDQYAPCVKKYRQTISTLISNLIDQKPDEDAFYLKLWENIENPSMFPTDMDEIAALYLFALARKIPYYRLDGEMAMSDETYKEISMKILPQFWRARFAINFGYELKTEEASLICRLYDALKTEEEKVVFLAQVLDYKQKEGERIERRLAKLKEKSRAERAAQSFDLA